MSALTPRGRARLFPEGMEWVESYGLRVVTPLPVLHKLPLVANALQTLEHGLARPLAPLGSFYDLVLRKLPEFAGQTGGPICRASEERTNRCLGVHAT